MTRHFLRIFAACSLALAACASAVAACVTAFGRMAVAALSTVARPMLHPPFGTLAHDAGPMLFGIAPSLYHDNRHEAGVSRRSAARNV